MRILTLLILTIFFFILCENPLNWSEVSDGIRFRLWTDKSIYQDGEDIWLYVEFENVGPESRVILVSAKQDQLPEEAPLYDIGILITRFKRSDNDKTFKIYPILSNMWYVDPDLLKLQPGKKYQEKTKLNSGHWRHQRESFSYLESGKYTLQAIYKWDELPYPSPERENQLEQLGAPLWQGYLESNKITITVISWD